MPSISSPIIRWRNFRLTPLELLIIVLTILGIIFLISTWNQDTESAAPASAGIWEQATLASEHTSQQVEQLRDEVAALRQTLQTMEERLRVLEQNPAATLKQYTVKAGDTLVSIARAHNISVAELRAWNNLEPDATIKAGQKLSLVPVN